MQGRQLLKVKLCIYSIGTGIPPPTKVPLALTQVETLRYVCTVHVVVCVYVWDERCWTLISVASLGVPRVCLVWQTVSLTHTHTHHTHTVKLGPGCWLVWWHELKRRSFERDLCLRVSHGTAAILRVDVVSLRPLLKPGPD